MVLLETTDKAYDPAALAKSSIITPRVGGDVPPGAGAGSWLWLAAQTADLFPAWGTNVATRDRLLREFASGQEPVLAGAMATVIARNAALTWLLDGPPRTLSRSHDMLHNANFGAGWLDFVTKFCWDLYGQDSGAFVEIIKDDPASPVSTTVGIANLDAARCYHTGDPERPVVYRDRDEKYHVLSWWRVWTSAEMPMPHETLYGQQMCAVSRVLNAARVYRDESTYIAEKVAGRNNRAIHFISGMNPDAVEAAIAKTQAIADQRGQSRYIQPTVAVNIRADTPISVATLHLASLPDGFDAMTEFQRYVAVIAMCFLTDYLELAPLPGSNLGTATQAQTMEKKSHAKGAQLFAKLIEHMMNFSGILPKNVEFSYEFQDSDKDKADEGMRLLRAQRRKQMIDNGEIDADVSRQMALDDGDIPQDIYDAMMAAATPDVTGPADSIEIDDSKPDDLDMDNTKIEDSDQAAIGSKAVAPFVARTVRDIVRDDNGLIVRIVEHAE